MYIRYSLGLRRRLEDEANDCQEINFFLEVGFQAAGNSGAF